jgi:uncharacterized protein DUF6491
MTLRAEACLRLAAAAVLGLSLSGSAALAADAPTAKDRTANIRPCIDDVGDASWTPYDATTLLVRSAGKSFRVTSKHCPGLSRIFPTVSTVLRGGSSICSPTDVELYVDDRPGIQSVRCFIDTIEPLTNDEYSSLMSAKKNK